jgi:hypothetical protein
VNRQFGAWKLRQDGIANEFYNSTLIALHYFARQRVKDFDELERAGFVLRATRAISRNIGKPKRNKVMDESWLLHPEIWSK